MFLVLQFIANFERWQLGWNHDKFRFITMKRICHVLKLKTYYIQLTVHNGSYKSVLTIWNTWVSVRYTTSIKICNIPWVEMSSDS